MLNLYGIKHFHYLFLLPNIKAFTVLYFVFLTAVAKEWQNCIQWAEEGRDMSYLYVGNPSNISARGIALHSSNQMENVKTISILVVRFTSHDSWKLNTSIVATDHCRGFRTLDSGDEEKNSTLCIYSPSRANASDLSSTDGEAGGLSFPMMRTIILPPVVSVLRKADKVASLSTWGHTYLHTIKYSGKKCIGLATNVADERNSRN